MSPRHKQESAQRRAKALFARHAVLAGAEHCPVTDKFGWRTQRGARCAMQIAARAGQPVWRVYRCEHCSRWHMTSKQRATHEPVAAADEDAEEGEAGQ